MSTPILGGDMRDDLVGDIRKNGLLTSITLHEEKILDGRNRYRACQAAGIQPHFERLPDGIDPPVLIHKHAVLFAAPLKEEPEIAVLVGVKGGRNPLPLRIAYADFLAWLHSGLR